MDTDEERQTDRAAYWPSDRDGWMDRQANRQTDERRKDGWMDKQKDRLRY